MVRATTPTGQVPATSAPRKRKGIRGVAADACWIVRDCAQLHGGRVVLSIGVAVLGQITMVTAVGGALKFVQAVQNERPIHLARAIAGIRLDTGISLNPGASSGHALVIIAALFAFVIFSAAFQWWGRALGANVVRRYENDCTRRALEQLTEVLVKTPGPERSAPQERLLKQSLLKLVTRDTRYCGRAANEAVMSVTPALTATAALGVLLWLGWVPVVGLVAIVAAVSPLYVRVNRLGMAGMRRLQTLARGDALKKADIIGSALSRDSLPDLAALRAPETQHYLDAYEARLKMSHTSILVGNVLFAAGLSSVLLFFVLFHGRGIGAGFIVYLLGLQYLLYSLRTIGKHVTSISAFHPMFSRYVDFMRTRSIAVLEQRPDKTAVVPGEEALIDEVLDS